MHLPHGCDAAKRQWGACMVSAGWASNRGRGQPTEGFPHLPPTLQARLACMHTYRDSPSQPPATWHSMADKGLLLSPQSKGMGLQIWLNIKGVRRRASSPTLVLEVWKACRWRWRMSGMQSSICYASNTWRARPVVVKNPFSKEKNCTSL